MLVTAGIGGYFVFQSFATVSPPRPLTEWYWDYPAEGFANYEQSITIEAATPNSPYFWATQFGFIDGHMGYMGLQASGNRADGTVGKSAVFSMFKAGIAATPQNCKIEQNNFDGYSGWAGTSCIIAYDWQPGHKYSLHIARNTVEDDGTWWWGWIVDTTTNKGTFIAKIKVPPSWKGLGDMTNVWTEYYGGAKADCKDIPYSKVYFHKPTRTYNYKAVEPTRQVELPLAPNPCADILTTNTNDGTSQQVGNPDLAGNPNVTTIPAMVIDTLAPVVRISQQKQASETRLTKPYFLNATATDNKAVTKMEVYLDNRLVKSVNSNNISYTWKPQAKGRVSTHILKMVAYDAAGNKGIKALSTKY